MEHMLSQTLCMNTVWFTGFHCKHRSLYNHLIIHGHTMAYAEYFY